MGRSISYTPPQHIWLYACAVGVHGWRPCAGLARTRARSECVVGAHARGWRARACTVGVRGWRPCARLARATCAPTARASAVPPAELKNCRSRAGEVRGRLAFSARATCAPTARASAVPPAELTNCRWRAGEVHGRRTLYTHTHTHTVFYVFCETYVFC